MGNERADRWRKMNPERAKAARQRYRATHPKADRAAHIRRKYGMSLEDERRMYDEQDGLCSICRNHEDKLHIDHDHTTGRVRGLLCENCNKGIGFLNDDVETLHSAIDYLECHAIDVRMEEFRSQL